MFRVFFCAFVLINAAPASATSVGNLVDLIPLWEANAPRCEGSPSSEDCEDGDMTLFSGLLCSVGEEVGCAAVKAAQDGTGRWHRSPRLRNDPSLKPTNSFSWDMALGVQLYAIKTNDSESFERWLAWVERSRPCISESPELSGQTYCLIRGWPRFCTDDTEKGCTAKPQNLATLAIVAEELGATLPEPFVEPVPGGLDGAVLRLLQREAAESNAMFSLKTLLPSAETLQPDVLMIDSAINREGYSRHLAGVENMLLRAVMPDNQKLAIAAKILASRELNNPFLQYLDSGASPRAVARATELAPKSREELPEAMEDWTWQRAESDETWQRSNLWDFIFIARLFERGALYEVGPEEAEGDV